MASIDVMLPEIHAEVPKLADLIARRALLRSARNFAEETRALRTSFDVDTVSGTPFLDLSAQLPAETELVDVVSIKPNAGGRKLTPTTYAKLDDDTLDWRNRTATVATHYVRDANNTIRLVYTPDATDTAVYHVRAAYKPTLDATTLDDLIINKYDEAIIHGALARLFSQPNKVWSDPNNANYHAAMFMDMKRKATTEAADGYQQNVPRRVQYGGP